MRLRTTLAWRKEPAMSEPNRAPEPHKEGGLKPAEPAPQPTDQGLTQPGGGETRSNDRADDVEREESSGRREGGMIGEG